MHVSCLFGHHNWNECKCSNCGKTRPHKFDGCKCSICGQRRNEEHDWEGCKCLRCGRVRDEEHDWDGGRCLKCGEFRSVLIVNEYRKTNKFDPWNQRWMTNNLDVDCYSNGDPIPYVKDKRAWRKLETGAWCYYNNSPKNGKIYGKLYNWYAVNDPRGLAPEGWKIPRRSDIISLLMLAHSYDLKAIGEGILSFRGDARGSNLSGFSALLAGSRNKLGDYDFLGKQAFFWTSDVEDMRGRYWNTALAFCLYDDRNESSFCIHGKRDMDPYPDARFLKNNAFSVRCLKSDW